MSSMLGTAATYSNAASFTAPNPSAPGPLTSWKTALDLVADSSHGRGQSLAAHFDGCPSTPGRAKARPSRFAVASGEP
jgi:hypothetical protein